MLPHYLHQSLHAVESLPSGNQHAAWVADTPGRTSGSNLPSDVDSHSHGYADRYAVADRHSDCHTDANPYTGAHVYPYRNAYTGATATVAATADGHADSDSHSQSDTVAV
jgi:hypothetical protein